jgi:hypothetical protein
MRTLAKKGDKNRTAQVAAAREVHFSSKDQSEK